MSATHTLTSTVASDQGDSSVTGSIAAVGSNNQVINTTFAAGGSNVAFPISFAHATLKSIVLKSTVNMTILVNSTGSPILTINLIANWPYTWNSSDGYWTNPFTADVTTFYVSNTPAGRLTGKVLN